MNTKFTILVAAGLLFAGVSQAQGTSASEFKHQPRHEMVRHEMARHEVRKEVRKTPHHKMHQKVKRHHKKMQSRKHGHR